MSGDIGFLTQGTMYHCPLLFMQQVQFFPHKFVTWTHQFLVFVIFGRYDSSTGMFTVPPGGDRLYYLNTYLLVWDGDYGSSTSEWMERLCVLLLGMEVSSVRTKCRPHAVVYPTSVKVGSFFCTTICNINLRKATEKGDIFFKKWNKMDGCRKAEQNRLSAGVA